MVKKLTFGESCDTFVVFGKTHGEPCVIFGKNSDRPSGESQEVIFINAKEYGQRETTVQCTHLRIPQVQRTLAVLLSKPAWMWGAEMGANEKGVVIGNEAVWDRLIDPVEDLQPRLLGMDLLRLGLERGVSAASALRIITGLLEEFGQGGSCSDTIDDFAYHNSFMIADASEAWVLETAGKWWVAKRLTEGSRNISNCMSVGADMDRMHPGLKEHARSSGWWKEGEPFNWTNIISNDVMQQIGSGPERFVCGAKLLKNMENAASAAEFPPASMMRVLRDEKSGICRPYGHESGFPTAGSQVSLLLPRTGRHFHWFTATSEPQRSLFKPMPSFEFLKANNELSSLTKSKHPFPDKVEDTCNDRAHELWQRHRSAITTNTTTTIWTRIEEMEKQLLEKVSAAVTKGDETMGNVFHEAVQMEMDVYLKFSSAATAAKL